MYGLDVHKAIVDNIYANTSDYAHETFKLPNYVDILVKQDKYGMKTEEGLYKIKEEKVYDIETEEYRPIRKYNIPFIDKVIEKFREGEYEDGINIILEDVSKEAKICKKFLINYIVYAIRISKEVANNVQDCDIAMAEGFNWIPPYALIQIIGKERCKELALQSNIAETQIINEIFEDNIKSKYRYEKFLKAKR